MVKIEKNILGRSFRYYQIYGNIDLIIADGLRHEYFSSRTYKVTARVSVCLCTKGEAVFKVNGSNFHFQRNDVLVVRPDSLISTLSISEDFDLSLIVATHHFFMRKTFYSKSISLADMMRFINQRPVLHLSESDTSFFQNTRKLILQTILSKNDKFKDEILYSLSSSLMMWVSAQISFQMQTDPVILTHNDEMIMKFLNLLKDHYKEEHRLDYYAIHLFVTAKYLSAVCRKVTTHPAGKMIVYAIIAESKRLLLDSHLTVSQIATELGFPNQSSFGKYFKKEIGMTPSEFRQSI